VPDRSFAGLTADPDARRRHYRQLVRSYFDWRARTRCAGTSAYAW
jgi:hypothetical protein